MGVMLGTMPDRKLRWHQCVPFHDLAPVGTEMMEITFDGAVGVTKIFFVEFFNVLFFNAVDDALHAEVGDRLLQVKILLKFLRFFLEGEYFQGG